jgi:hypothetical protein
MKNFSRQIPVVFLVFNCLSSFSQNGNTTDGGLYNEIYSADSAMFSAFNNRDTTRFGKMFAKDLEFFHDKGGLTGYDNTTGFLIKLLDEKSD